MGRSPAGRLRCGCPPHALLPGWACAASCVVLALVTMSSLLDSTHDNELLLDVTATEGLLKLPHFPRTTRLGEACSRASRGEVCEERGPAAAEA